MRQSQDATKAGIDPESLTAEQILIVREFIRSVGGIEQAKKAAEELANSQKAA